MASHFEDEDPTVKECANCGSKDNLGRCSKCHQAWFCSLKCQKAYWPFHKEWCTRNDFADLIEKQEPKFAKWMRKHGKQAVLKDGASKILHAALVAPSGLSQLQR